MVMVILGMRLVVLATLFLWSGCGFCQQPLPVPPIAGEPPDIAKYYYPATEETEYVYFPQPPDIEGVSFNVNYRISSKCLELGAEDLERHPDYSEEIASPFVGMAKGLPDLVFKICRSGGPFPHGSSEARYLFAVSDEGKGTSLMLSALNTSSSSYDYSPKDKRSYKGELEVSDGDWRQLAPDTFSFVQTVRYVSEQKLTNAVEGVETVEQDMYRRVFNLFTFTDQGVKRTIHSLPLADYTWTERDTAPNLTDQLSLALDFPETISVYENSEVLSDSQQAWLGTFSLEVGTE